MYRAVTIFFGFIFLTLGALGFFDTLLTDQKLFGIFETNLSNQLFYLFIGFFGVFSGFFDQKVSRFYFINVGTLLLAAALLGFLKQTGVVHGDFLLKTFAYNHALNWLYLGFGFTYVLLGALEPKNNG